MQSHLRPLTRWQVFHQSWPIMLANALAPIVGLVDTFVVGRYVGTSALAGIGLGAVIYGIFYWGFGFLRMSTAGLTAQSNGQDNQTEVKSHLLRAVPLGLFIGLAMLAFQFWLLPLAFKVYTASETIETAAATYIQARLWGLPATLGSIALMGWFVGIGRAHRALIMQIVLNVVNICLSLYFVLDLNMGLYGVGLASAVAEWIGLGAGIYLAWGAFKRRGGVEAGLVSRANLLDIKKLQKLGITNTNIFIRTITLTIGFNFFGNAAASQGETFLAANHIHMQFITMAALVLDAFAHTAEAATGSAYGAKDRARFDRAVKLTSEFSVLFGLLIGWVIFIFGPFIINLLTIDPEVRLMARSYLPYCALAPIVGFAALQLDGIFIGTTRTQEMRNAGIMALIIYLGAHFVLQPQLHGVGIWLAFLIYYIARAVTLGFYIPSIRRSLQPLGQS